MSCVGELLAYASVNANSKISRLQLLAFEAYTQYENWVIPSYHVRNWYLFVFDSIWYYINNNPYSPYHKYKLLFLFPVLMNNSVASHTQVSHTLTKSTPYMDYEIFLGPIELYDWDGQFFFDVNFALSLI